MKALFQSNRILSTIWLATLGIGLSSCESILFEEEPGTTPNEIYTQYWLGFKEYYGGFEERGVDWDSVLTHNDPKVRPNIGEDSLFNILCSMIKVLDDGHVSLVAPNREEYRSNQYYREFIGYDLYDEDVIKSEYLNGNYETVEWEGQEAWYHGSMGPVGYIHLNWISDELYILEELPDIYADKEGLIIDLRHNAGGDFTWTQKYIGRYTDEERVFMKTTTRNGPEYDDFDPWFEWSIVPEDGYYDKPIVVLTNRFCISAGERTALMFKSLPNVKLVGQPTNGSLATMIGKDLANGWTYRLPVQKVRDGNNINFEGVGIPVDLEVENDKSQLLQGIDNQLDAAVNLF